MINPLVKNNGLWEQSTVGQQGTWIDQQTGLGYSGPKKKETDIAYQSQVGQQQNLNQNPVVQPTPQNPNLTTSPQIPIVPQANTALNQGGNQQTTTGNTTTATQSPIDKFNLAILDMLQKAQGTAGNESLYARQTALQRAQIGASTDYSGTEGLSPSAQENVASARAGEYSPEIDSIGAKIKTNDSRLQNFESILGQMRSIGNDMKIKPSDDILQKYVDMIEAGGSLSSVPDAIQQDVLAKTTADTWRKQAQAISKAKESSSTPSSYQEWSLAGGQQGTGKTYAEFLTSTKPPTQAEFTVAGFATRMTQANDIINNMESTVANMNPLTYGLQSDLHYPNYLKSSDIQSIEQAERNFVNSILRRESGAAISPTEFDSAKLQYFPQPGDSQSVLAQKKKNRDTSIQGLINAAGTAYQQTGTGNSIRVIEKSSGRTGTIPENEFDPNLYTKIQ